MTTLRALVAGILLFVVAGAAEAQVAQVLRPVGPNTITANGQAVCFPVDRSIGALTLTVAGAPSWTGTIASKVRTADGVTNFDPPSGPSFRTDSGLLAVQNAGYTHVCGVATAAITGTATITAVVGGNGGGPGGVGGGDASAANQVTGNSTLANIDSKTPALVSGRQPVDGSGVTQPISASSLPLPAGAATAANQSAATTELVAIKTAIQAVQAEVGTANTPVPHISVGLLEDEFEVSTVPAVLALAVCRNSNTTTDAYLRFTNATMGNTTPGTTPVIVDVLIPAGAAGNNVTPLDLAFSTAITGYIVTGKALTDTAEVAANDVFCVVGKR